MAIREKPVIGIAKPWRPYQELDHSSLGCVLMPMGIVASYFVLMAIMHVISSTATRLEQYISVGALAGIIVIFILGMRSFYQDGIALAIEKEKWKKACKVAQVKILEHSGGTWDDGNRYHSAWHLTLEMSPDQMAVSPNQTTVSARVTENIYERLKKSSNVRIYYLPETPLVFLLEEEL